MYHSCRVILRLFVLVAMVSIVAQECNAQGIVGGKEVEADKYPFMVGILVETPRPGLVSSLSCGGSVIADKWVLTAGHCTEGWNANEMHVLIGNYDLQNASQGKKIRVKRIVRHPLYGRLNNDPNDIALYDVALLELEESAFVEPIKIPKHEDNDYEIEKLECQIMGWGVYNPSNPTDKSNKLKEANVHLISRETCRDYEQYDIVTKNMICAGQLQRGSSAQGGAAGDSGGPLVVEYEKGKWLQLGVMSWGRLYTRYEAPGVYQRVASYTKWIEEVIGSVLTKVDETFPFEVMIKEFADRYEITFDQSIQNLEVELFNTFGQVIEKRTEHVSTQGPLVITKRNNTEIRVLRLRTGSSYYSRKIRL